MFAQSRNALGSTTFVQSRVSGDKPMHTADICLAGTLCLATGGNRDLSDFQSIALDPCGRAEIVYTNDTGTGYTVFAQQGGGASLLSRPPAGCVQAASTVAPAPTAAATPTPKPPNPSTPGATGVARLVAFLLAAACAIALTRVRRVRV